MKPITAKLIAFVFLASLAACTSNKSDAPSENQEVANDTTSEISDVAAETGGDESGADSSEFGSDETVAGGDSAEAATDSSAAASDQPAAEGSSDEFGDLESDQAPAADGKDQAVAEAPADGAAAAGEEDPFADPADAEKTGDQAAASDATDPFADPATPAESNLSTDAAPTDTPAESTPAADSLAGIGDSQDSSYTGAPAPASLKKISTTPYQKAGHLVNAVYIARKGDSLKSISQKIYGANRKKDLAAINPHLASRDLAVGDKVYYNSPQRPNDDKQLLTYYEDMGLSPEYYVAQEGDNIRTVGKQLLGDSKSWKEIWATNMDVESKDVLSGGTRLRYWSNEMNQTTAAPVAMGSTGQEPPPPPAQEIPPLPDQSQQMAQNEMPPPPPPVEAQQAAPPPPQNMAIQEAAPPPPPIEAPKVEPPAANPMSGILGGDDTTALIAGAVLLLAAVFMVIIIRKRKSRKNIDFHTATHTQLE